MSNNNTSDVTSSIKSFLDRGGLSGPHKDGWGICYYEDSDVFRIREARAASNSSLAKQLMSSSLASNIVISHIRLATQGQIKLKNNQPFIRELFGKTYTFAHNGDLKELEPFQKNSSVRFNPVGDTDSEIAFCLLLNKIVNSKTSDDIDAVFKVFTEFSRDMRPLGPANFIFSDGEFLMIHGNKRMHCNQKKPTPPGLWYIQRHCNVDEKVFLAASEPLTEEKWTMLEEGETLLIKGGKIIQKLKLN